MTKVTITFEVDGPLADVEAVVEQLVDERFLHNRFADNDTRAGAMEVLDVEFTVVRVAP